MADLSFEPPEWIIPGNLYFYNENARARTFIHEGGNEMSHLVIHNDPIIFIKVFFCEEFNARSIMYYNIRLQMMLNVDMYENHPVWEVFSEKETRDTRRL